MAKVMTKKKLAGKTVFHCFIAPLNPQNEKSSPSFRMTALCYFLFTLVLQHQFFK